jgi:hypothetical protein
MPARPAAAMLAALLLGTAMAAGAQAPPAAREEADSARAFIEMLRRTDPAAAAQFTALREARDRSVVELRETQAQYAAAGPELRAAFIGKVRGAQRRYAEASLAILEFLDARDTKTLRDYQAAIAEITAMIENRRQTRAELQRMLRDE